MRADLQALFKMRSLADWVEKLEKVDCCASPVRTLEEAMQNEPFVAHRLFVETERRTSGRLTQFALPIKMSDFEFSIDRPAPHRGEHSIDILTALGYSEERLAQLKEKGVI